MLDKPVYIIPLHQNQNSLTFSITGKSIVLVAIIDYPNPDPENHMYPHMLVFNDGTGINLGRLLQVSINRPFNPGKEDIIYKDKNLQKSLMFRERQLNEESIRLTSKIGLSELLNITHDHTALIQADPIKIASLKSTICSDDKWRTFFCYVFTMLLRFYIIANILIQDKILKNIEIQVIENE